MKIGIHDRFETGPRRASRHERPLRRLLSLLAAVLLIPTTATAATQEISLVPGFNFVGITVGVSGLTSRSLLEREPSISGIYRYEGRDRGYLADLRIGEGDMDGTAFAMPPGRGYVVRATAAAHLVLVGEPLPRGHECPVDEGFALLAAPRDTSARELLATHPEFLGVYRWDTDARRYRDHLRVNGEEPTSGSFRIPAGQAFLVRTTRAGRLRLPMTPRRAVSLSLAPSSATTWAGSDARVEAEVVYDDGLREPARDGVWSGLDGEGVPSVSADGRLLGPAAGLVRVAYATGGTTLEASIAVRLRPVLSVNGIPRLSPDSGGFDPIVAPPGGEATYVVFASGVTRVAVKLGGSPLSSGEIYKIVLRPVSRSRAARSPSRAAGHDGPALTPDRQTDFPPPRTDEELVIDAAWDAYAENTVVSEWNRAPEGTPLEGYRAFHARMEQERLVALSEPWTMAVPEQPRGDTTVNVMRDANPAIKNIYRYDRQTGRYESGSDCWPVDPGETYVAIWDFDAPTQAWTQPPTLQGVQWTGLRSMTVTKDKPSSMPEAVGSFGPPARTSPLSEAWTTHTVGTGGGLVDVEIAGGQIVGSKEGTAEVVAHYGRYNTDTLTVIVIADLAERHMRAMQVALRAASQLRVGMKMFVEATVKVSDGTSATPTHTRGGTSFGSWAVNSRGGGAAISSTGELLATGPGEIEVGYSEGAVRGTFSVQIIGPRIIQGVNAFVRLFQPAPLPFSVTYTDGFSTTRDPASTQPVRDGGAVWQEDDDRTDAFFPGGVAGIIPDQPPSLSGIGSFVPGGTPGVVTRDDSGSPVRGGSTGDTYPGASKSTVASLGYYYLISGAATITNDGWITVNQPGPVRVGIVFGDKTTEAVITGYDPATPRTLTVRRKGFESGIAAAVVPLATTTDFHVVDPADTSIPETARGLWDVVPQTGIGRITQTGRFTAELPGRTLVRYRSPAGVGTLAVEIPGFASVEIESGTGPVPLNLARSLTSVVTWSNGSTSNEVLGSWAVLPGTGDATITQAGVVVPKRRGDVVAMFTPPGRTTPVRKTITVGPPVVFRLNLTAPATTVGPGQTVEFTSVDDNVPAGSETEWLVEGVVGGTAGGPGTIEEIAPGRARFVAGGGLTSLTRVRIGKRLKRHRNVVGLIEVPVVP